MPKTIVVPLDGSELAERALAVARPLAARVGAGVVVLGCAWAADLAETRAYVDGFVGDGQGVPVEGEVIEDWAPPDAIRHAADARPDSLICMTTHGRGRLRWALVGSVAEQVLRDASAPVLMVGPRGAPCWDESARRVVVCADGSDVGPMSVRAACDWARLLDLELYITSVAHPLDVTAAGASEAVLEPLADIARAEGVPVHVQALRSSYAAGTLVDVAESPPATLMVMAAHGRKGVVRAALGSVTMAVLNVAPCPVLVVPPHLETPEAESGDEHGNES